MVLHHPSAHRDSSTLFSQDFDKVPHAVLLNKLNQFGLSSSYVKWFQSYLLNRSSYVRILGKFSSPFSVLSGVPQGSILGPLLFNIFVNDLSDIIKHSKFILFADDLKIYRNVKSVEDCKALQADVYSVQHWCAENHMELNIQKTKTISFTRKTNSVHFN
jgi:retron-type reverse transcriptase